MGNSKTALGWVQFCCIFVSPDFVVLVYHHFRLFELYTAHPLIVNRYF